jgi:hypothetical protein
VQAHVQPRLRAFNAGARRETLRHGTPIVVGLKDHDVGLVTRHWVRFLPADTAIEGDGVVGLVPGQQPGPTLRGDGANGGQQPPAESGTARVRAHPKLVDLEGANELPVYPVCTETLDDLRVRAVGAERCQCRPAGHEPVDPAPFGKTDDGVEALPVGVALHPPAKRSPGLIRIAVLPRRNGEDLDVGVGDLAGDGEDVRAVMPHDYHVSIRSGLAHESIEFAINGQPVHDLPHGRRATAGVDATEPRHFDDLPPRRGRTASRPGETRHP